VDDADPIPLKLRPRGSAGVATLWHKSWSENILALPDGGDRVQAISVSTTSGPVIIINTYMPASGTLSDATYEGALDEVFEIYQKYSPTTTIIWTGDMNAHPSRKKLTANDRQFIAFCKENDLLVHPLTPNVPTYHHFSNSASSQIDHAVHQSSHSQVIQKVEVNIRAALNTSPHDAIVITTNKSMECLNAQKDQGTSHQPLIALIGTQWIETDMQA
jgi:quinolinate synthase